MTVSRPPCLILSLMFIFLVSLYLACILAVRSELIFFIILTVFPCITLWWSASSIASSHALSYAYCTWLVLCLFRSSISPLIPCLCIVLRFHPLPSCVICLEIYRLSQIFLLIIPLFLCLLQLNVSLVSFLGLGVCFILKFCNLRKVALQDRIWSQY